MVALVYYPAGEHRVVGGKNQLVAAPQGEYFEVGAVGQQHHGGGGPYGYPIGGQLIGRGKGVEGGHGLPTVTDRRRQQTTAEFAGDNKVQGNV